MCGIMGYIGDAKASRLIHEGLRRLEYRGYDSAGIATLSDNPGLEIRKDKGEIADIHEKVDFHALEGNIGIGHTRWATHGGVTKQNAHPHTDCDERLAIVHNGIIENHEQLADSFDDCSIDSDTDTEIIAHYFENKFDNGASHREAIEAFMDEAEGTFAVVMVDKKDGRLFAMKHKSPLALGIGEDGYFLGSDLYAFSPHTNEAILLEDGEYAIISEDDFGVYHRDTGLVERDPRTFEWEEKEQGTEEYDHYMIKEIHEQPQAIRRLLQTFDTSQKEELSDIASRIKDASKVIFTAAGTSYHAALLGVYLFQRAGIEAQALIASEFQNYERVDEDTLVIAVSQSGETMDVLEAIDYSDRKGGEIASIVNVPHSSIQRESAVSLEAHAGQEICVAATKSFTNQVVALMGVAEELGLDIGLETVADEIEDVIEANEPQVKKLADQLDDADDLYVIGRGPTYPISRELALKLKEIPYIHAEGMMGGELKHGTLALIEDGTPVVSLIPDENDEIISNVEEVEARGAESIRISPYYGRFDMPEEPTKFALYATTIGFMLSYYIAKHRDLPIDKPRNLAKSVTVK